MPADRRCRDCGAACHYQNRNSRCPDCSRRYCSHCQEALPEGRLTRRCSSCQQEYKERLYAREHPCKECRRPLSAGTRAEICPECRRTEYEYYCRLPARPCIACGRQLPAGRRQSLCSLCYGQRRREREKQNGLTQCARCSTGRRGRSSSYCRVCANLMARFRRLHIQGDPIAKYLGPKRKNQRRQERAVLGAGC